MRRGQWSSLASSSFQTLISMIGALRSLALMTFCSKYELLKSATTIIHNGAQVNMTLPYHLLKPVNVGGTLEVFHFITFLIISRLLNQLYRHRAHHIFTTYLRLRRSLLVYMKKNRLYFVIAMIWKRRKGKPPNICISSPFSYGQTKVVSERLVYEAHRRYNLDVRIHRPCSISGSTQKSGFSNKRDFTNILLKAVIDMKAFPKAQFIPLRANLSLERLFDA